MQFPCDSIRIPEVSLIQNLTVELMTHLHFRNRLLESEDVCPMCSEKVDSQNLEKARDLEKILHPEEGADE